ncbi:MAG: hypothetical protein J2P18_24015, partial [Nocardia sp.]|nr:hypothetical protein [Nocardia sp.]
MVRVEVAGVRHRFDTTRTRAFARSSPARLVALGLLLLALCLIAGTIIADDIGNRQRGLADLLAEAEPDANSAQDLYTSLSVADAAAGTAFISGGLEPAAVRDRYTQAIGQAAAELAARSETGSGSAASGSDAALRTRMATELPVYTGLIETARTNNREGHPVGAAYLSEASNVMQTTLLPAARQFQQHRSAAITDGRLGPTVPPWMAIILPVLTLATLVAAQVYLARHWHRLLNPGMLAASAIVAILLIWVVTAGSISALSAADGRDRGAVPTTALAQGRILAQQARTAETLKLVRRDYSAGYDTTF